MEKFDKVKIFGHVKNCKIEFNGEVVSVENTEKDYVSFYYKGKLLKIHEKQCQLLKLGYPHTIYVRDSGLDGLIPAINRESCEVVNADISNCYARQGSHWIRYYSDPRDNYISNISEEQEKEEDFDSFEVLISKEKLKKILLDNKLSESNVEANSLYKRVLIFVPYMKYQLELKQPHFEHKL